MTKVDIIMNLMRCPVTHRNARGLTTKPTTSKGGLSRLSRMSSCSNKQQYPAPPLLNRKRGKCTRSETTSRRVSNKTKVWDRHLAGALDKLEACRTPSVRRSELSCHWSQAETRLMVPRITGRQSDHSPDHPLRLPRSSSSQRRGNHLHSPCCPACGQSMSIPSAARPAHRR